MQKNGGVCVSQRVEADSRQSRFARKPDRGARSAGGQEVIAARIGKNQAEIDTVVCAEQRAMLVLALLMLLQIFHQGPGGGYHPSLPRFRRSMRSFHSPS